MKFRRKKSEQAEAQAADPVETPEVPQQGAPSADAASRAAGAAGDRVGGPFDVSEVELDEEDPTRVDLGGLIVKGRSGIEMRLQVDEASQQVAAVLLVGAEGALELRPFAAPRNGDIWGDVRKQIAAETARRGGTATEAEGTFGTELRVMMPVKTPEGKAATQPSRVLGIAGPRWLLRATFLGRPAVEPDDEGDLESALRDVVVVRGSSPMAPGEPLPLVMPSNARPAPAQDS
ncbi:MAG TPA: DUF3710 domain-containing protein [Nocardioidaceae bacterium]|nr:DUF3710 domain-containing protein [Nocardioidaceae bacterium]